MEGARTKGEWTTSKWVRVRQLGKHRSSESIDLSENEREGADKRERRHIKE